MNIDLGFEIEDVVILKSALLHEESQKQDPPRRPLVPSPMSVVEISVRIFSEGVHTTYFTRPVAAQELFSGSPTTTSTLVGFDRTELCKPPPAAPLEKIEGTNDV